MNFLQIVVNLGKIFKSQNVAYTSPQQNIYQQPLSFFMFSLMKMEN